MGGGTLLRVLAVALVLQLAAAVFFHEKSSIPIMPYDKPKGFSDFGFAMGYRAKPEMLVVGAPRENDIGNIYSCDTKRAYGESLIECDQNFFDLESIAKYSRDVNPSQYFYTGSSIAATSDYIFTCAPMWTSNVKNKATSNHIMSDAFGTCFVMNETSSYRYKGTLERYQSHGLRTGKTNAFRGGTGWSTLVDEENDLLLIVKTSLDGDFVYTPMSKPLGVTKSWVLQKDKESRKILETRFLKEHWNIGYGITAGKFFSSNKTVYPFSMLIQRMEGAISFLEYNSTQNELSIMYDGKAPYKLINTAIGTMFGSAMAAANLNMDGKDELLVGAPAQSEDNCAECGALHIYLGGDMKTLSNNDRLRTILGTAELGRFGTAITASDIDGDSLSEIVVSAPYENEGRGAIYILSGYELYRSVIKFKIFQPIQLSDLKLTQRIQQEPYRLLGFSLQFIGDVDDNSCRELVAGSPGNASAVLFKCMPTVNVTISNELIGEQPVREQAQNFTVKVCAQVQLHKLPKHIQGNLSVVSSVIGVGTSITDPEFRFDISCYNCKRDLQFCNDVIVHLSDQEPGDYTFTSKAALQTEQILSSDDFNSSWVVASPYSKLEDSLGVPRHCRGKDCVANLSMTFQWSDRSHNKYKLGSSVSETVTILVRNDGNESYGACVWMRVSGAPVIRVNCNPDNNENEYICYVDNPLRRHTEYSINLVVDGTKPTNLYQKLLVEASLLENCNKKKEKIKSFEVEYEMTTDNIFISGTSHNSNVTDTQVYNNETIFDVQEYQITNNGNIKWEKVIAQLVTENKPFILSKQVMALDVGECESTIWNNTIISNCTLNLEVNSTQKITATTEMLAINIEPYMYNEHLNLTSELKLHLHPTGVIKTSSVVTVMKFEKEMTFANNKLLISLVALLVALIILAILIFMLYRMGFFKRKQKQRLHVLRESIKQQSVRRNTHASTRDGPLDNVEGLQMDIDEDPFDDIPIPVTTQDNAVLVEECGPHQS